VRGWLELIKRELSISHRMTSELFTSKSKGESKSTPDKGQMVIDLIRVRNSIRTTNRWSQMSKW
jgi:hypothetical protein